MLKKKDRTRQSILKAIKKLKGREELITIKKISKIVGCSPQNLRSVYLSFIRENCKDLHFYKRNGEESTTYQMSDSQREKMNGFMEHSLKSCGIDLVDHGEKFTL